MTPPARVGKKRVTPHATRMKGIAFVLSAPSGSGKTTVRKRLLRRVDRLAFSVSCTTRPPRRGEREGRDYRFLSEKTFRQRVKQGRFLEWAEVHGCFYGTPREPVERVLRAGRDVLLEVDPKGARAVRAALRGRAHVVLALMIPPAVSDLRSRLRGRGGISPEEFERRMRDARKFVCAWSSYDYIVVNERIGECTAALRAVVEAERLRRVKQESRVKRFVRELSRTSPKGAMRL